MNQFQRKLAAKVRALDQREESPTLYHGYKFTSPPTTVKKVLMNIPEQEMESAKKCFKPKVYNKNTNHELTVYYKFVKATEAVNTVDHCIQVDISQQRNYSTEFLNEK